jgi:predicted TPR repeat methyltransferase
VDLTTKMLFKPRQLNIYDNLACGERIEFYLHNSAYDLPVAADVFVYVGDISALLMHAMHVTCIACLIVMRLVLFAAR